MGTIDSNGLAELLSAFLDGEVDQRERAYVERVLESDPKARALLEDLRATSIAIGELPRHSAPASIELDVLNRLERSDLLTGLTEAPSVVSGRGLGFRAFTAMAAMVGLGVISALLYYSDWNNLRPKLTDRLAGSMTESELAQPVLDKANVAHKLLQGVKLATLRSHPFVNETVRLQVFVGDRAERDSLSARLMNRLAKRQVADLVDLDSSDKKADAETSFYYLGEPSVNFEESDQSQILVRVPASALDELVEVIAGEQDSVDRITLAAGGLTFSGSKSTRAILRQLTGLSSKEENYDVEADLYDEFRSERFADATVRSTQPLERGRQKKMSEKNGMFDDIMDAVGMPRDLLEQDATTESFALGNSNSRSDNDELRENEEFDKLVDSRSKTASGNDSASVIFQKPDVVSKDKYVALELKDSPAVPMSSTAKESSGLVARRRRALRGGQAKSQISDVKPSESNRDSNGKPQAVAMKTRSTSSGKFNPVMREDSLVTLVIQLMPRKPIKHSASSKTSASKKTPISTKVGRESANQSKSDKTKSELKKPFG